MNIFLAISQAISQIGLFWQEKTNSAVFRWNIFLILVQSVTLFFKYNSLPPEIPLYYSRPWGLQQLAASSSIFLLPALSFIVMLFNNIFAATLLKSVPILSKLLVIVSLVFTAFSTVALFQIIFLIA